MSLLRDEWNSYRREVLPKDASPVHLIHYRRAFYSGARAVLASLDARDGGEQRWAIKHELDAFVDEVEAGRA